MQFWIAEALYAFVFFALLGVLLVAPWIHRQYVRFGRLRGWPALVSAATVLYGCALVAFTLFPLPDFTGSFCARREDLTYWQLKPFASLDDTLAYAQDHTFLQTLTSDVVLQVVMNVVFFVPLGVLLAYRWRRSLGVSVLVAAGVSLAIELTQGTGLWGLAPCPYRLADVDDLLTNTLGGVVGWFIGLACIRLLPSASPSPVPDLDPPSLGRRALAVGLDLLVYLLVFIGVLALDEEFSEAPDRGTVAFLVLGGAISLALFVLVPWLRRSRTGPGAASVTLALVGPGGAPAAGWSLLVRWAVRWLVLVVLGVGAFAIVVLVDGVVAWRRRDGRSVSDIVSRTSSITRAASVLG